MLDPELEGKSVALDTQPSTEIELGNGLEILGLAEEQIEQYGIFINEFYDLLRDDDRGQQITRNGLTMLRGAIFAVGSRLRSNPEWKEHCATSLREIFHQWNGLANFQSDLNKYYRKKENLSVDEKDIVRKFWVIYRYFCGVDHHNASSIMGSLQSLHNDSSLKLEDCYHDEIFIKTAKDFFSTLSQIIDIARKENGSD